MNEVWKDIDGYEGLYKISNLGNVFGIKNNKKITPVLNNDCSYVVSLSKHGNRKQFVISRLVAQMFIPEYTKWSKVIHVDGDKSNCKLDNLKVVFFEPESYDKYGDVEEWRDIDGYEGTYKVSNYGRIKSYRNSRKGYILTPGCNKFEYLQAHLIDDELKNHTASISRIVAQAFIPNPNGYPEVNHKSGNKNDNRVENLEWCTRSQNMLHMHRELYPDITKGEKNGMAVITEKEALEIYNLAIKEEYTLKEIGDMYGISLCTVSEIKTGRKWSHVTHKKFIKNLHKGSKLTDEDVRIIFYLASSGKVSYRTLADMYNLSSSRISDIKNKKAFMDITQYLDENEIPEKYMEILNIRKKWRLREFNPPL